MVNVDFSPALVLGAGLVGGGLALYQLRRMRPNLSRDFDVVVSSIAIFSGGILVFQGWRLDPLLLFCQLLTAGMALSFAVETLRLREEVEEAVDGAIDPRSAPPPSSASSRRAAPLPPPRATGEDYYDRWQAGVWASEGEEEEQGVAGNDRAAGYSAAADDLYYYTDAPRQAYYADGDGDSDVGPPPRYDDDDGGGGGALGSYGDAYWGGAPPTPAAGDWGGYGDAAPAQPTQAGDVEVGVGSRPAAPDDDWE